MPGRANARPALRHDHPASASRCSPRCRRAGPELPTTTPRFLPHLARHFDIDIFIDDYEVSDRQLRDSFVIRSHREFAARRCDYSGIVYEMGNSEFHAYMLDYSGAILAWSCSTTRS